MIQDRESKLKEREGKLGFAYNQVFARSNQFTETVLADLAKFCRGSESTFHADPRMHACLEGRREVFLRIEEYINLTREELFKLHTIRMEGRR